MINVLVYAGIGDKPTINLLKTQLSESKELNFLWPIDRDKVINSERNDKLRPLNELQTFQIQLMLVGNHWDPWLESELERSINQGIPVVGVLSLDSKTVKSPLFNSGKAPLVRWNYRNLAKILLGEAYTVDYNPKQIEELVRSPIIHLDFNKISAQLSQYFIKNPNAIYELSPRQFEEIVAYIMERYGYEVTLTQRSRDRGIDIFALKRDDFGNFLTIVDCKKYSKNNPVGIDIVRKMYGTLKVESASHAIIATTSRFTKDAKNLAGQFKYQLSLKDHANIIKWIENMTI